MKRKRTKLRRMVETNIYITNGKRRGVLQYLNRYLKNPCIFCSRWKACHAVENATSNWDVHRAYCLNIGRMMFLLHGEHPFIEELLPGIYLVPTWPSSWFLNDAEFQRSRWTGKEPVESWGDARLGEKHILPDGYEFWDIAPYGICDNPQQVLDHHPELADPERTFVVTMVELRREDQPEKWGWRWHKWGEYIGTQDPQHEYLYDDTHIDVVYTYHIYEKY